MTIRRLNARVVPHLKLAPKAAPEAADSQIVALRGVLVSGDEDVINLHNFLSAHRARSSTRTADRSSYSPS